jgi:hypothetical protein
VQKTQKASKDQVKKIQASQAADSRKRRAPEKNSAVQVKVEEMEEATREPAAVQRREEEDEQRPTKKRTGSPTKEESEDIEAKPRKSWLPMRVFQQICDSVADVCGKNS